MWWLASILRNRHIPPIDNGQVFSYIIGMELTEGIRQEGDSFIFDFERDDTSDIIKLTEEVKQLQVFGRVFYLFFYLLFSLSIF